MINAKQFNTDIVEPTLAEFDTDSSSVRRAFLAIAVLDALAAQIYAQAVENGITLSRFFDLNKDVDQKKADDGMFRQLIADNCTGFRIIRDVAKANKHAVLTRGNPKVTRSDQIVSKSKGYSLGAYGKGRYGGVYQVTVQYDGGKEVYLEDQVLEAHKTLMKFVNLLDHHMR